MVFALCAAKVRCARPACASSSSASLRPARHVGLLGKQPAHRIADMQVRFGRAKLEDRAGKPECFGGQADKGLGMLSHGEFYRPNSLTTTRGRLSKAGNRVNAE